VNCTFSMHIAYISDSCMSPSRCACSMIASLAWIENAVPCDGFGCPISLRGCNIEVAGYDSQGTSQPTCYKPYTNSTRVHDCTTEGQIVCHFFHRCVNLRYLTRAEKLAATHY
jgi:hypothetical protein